jgi:hypothetical protein
MPSELFCSYCPVKKESSYCDYHCKKRYNWFKTTKLLIKYKYNCGQISEEEYFKLALEEL